jgi:hypothetical protein
MFFAPSAPSRSTRARNVVDAGFATLLMSVAVLSGYAILAPEALGFVASRGAPAGAAMLPPDEPEEVEPAPYARSAFSISTAEAASPSFETTEPRRQRAPSPAPPRPSARELTRAPELPALRVPVAPRLAAPAPGEPREPWPAVLTGRVLDPQRQPLEQTSIVLGGVERFTEPDGTFRIEAPPAGEPLLVKRPGFERVWMTPRRGPVEVVLKPQAVKAAYLTYFGVGHTGIRGRVLQLAERTELNAVVIDVKGDRGWILYPTEVPLALAAGAQGPGTLRNFDALMAEFKARGLYTIARIVTFKDNILAHHRPAWAIIDTRTGQPWIDNEKLAWVDPFREEVWAYNIAIAKEAIARGFDEVQFDYVRFPTDGRLSAARYAKPNTRETRVPAIAGFLARARRELGPLGAFVGADIFGYTAFNDNDTDIGQRVEELAPNVDYLNPMVYPSGYQRGIPGQRNPVVAPYQVVHESVRLIRKRAGSAPMRVRPWLQDFRDYAFDRRIFGPGEVRAQIKGSEDAGGIGWMLWNPRNAYTEAALRGGASGASGAGLSGRRDPGAAAPAGSESASPPSGRDPGVTHSSRSDPDVTHSSGGDAGVRSSDADLGGDGQ